MPEGEVVGDIVVDKVTVHVPEIVIVLVGDLVGEGVLEWE